MSPLVETTLFIFGLVAIGYCSGWIGLLKPTTGAALSDFVFMVAVPLLLFRTMSRSEFGDVLPWGLWGTYFAAIAVTWAAGHLVVQHVFGRDTRAGVVAGMSASFSNLVLLGIPFMLSARGQEGFALLSLLVAVHLPVMIAASIVLHEWAATRDVPGAHRDSAAALARVFVQRLLSNPPVLGILVGLAWHLSGLELPGLANRFVDALAGVAGPLALFAMGLDLRNFGISGNVRPALAISGLKLFLMPALVLAIAKLTGQPPLTAKVAVAAASLSSGVNPYLVATKFGTGQALASNTITISTALAVVTTTLWLFAADAVF